MISARSVAPLCRDTRAQLDARTPTEDTHLVGCAACQDYRAQVQQMAGALDHVARGLDDLSRARIEANVLAALAPRPPRAWPWRRWAAWAWVPLAATAVLAMVRWSLPPAASAELSPRLVSGFVPPRSLTRAMLGGSVQAIEAPAGGRVEVQIEHVAVIELVGPGALHSAPTTPGDVELLLSSGRVLIDVDRGAGQTVRVRAGAVTVEVVGTRFLVDHRPPDRVEVAVMRGHVRVHTGAEAIELEAGSSWRSDAVVAAIDRASLQALSALRVERLTRPGVLQLEAPADVEVRSWGGGVLGRSPLWVALPAGRVALELRIDDRVIAAPTAEVHEGAATYLEVVLPQGASGAPASGSAVEPVVPASPTDGAADSDASSSGRALVADSDPSSGRGLAAADSDASSSGRALVADSDASSGRGLAADSDPSSGRALVADSDPSSGRGLAADSDPSSGRALAADSDPSSRERVLVGDRASSPRAAVRGPPHDAEQAYRRAESAMASGDLTEAAQHLDALVERFPSDALVPSALYERARLALDAGDRSGARARLARLRGDAKADPAIAEPAHALACQIELDDGVADDARACLLSFRERYPRSVHDRATLVELARLAEQAGGCQAARRWLELLVGLYPQDPAGLDASARLVRCPR